MRKPAVIIAVVMIVVVGALAVAATARRTNLAFTLGVNSTAAVVKLGHGQEVCQLPIDVPRGGSFDRVTFKAGTFRRPGPRLDVTVRDAGGRALARGTLRAGYPDIAAAPTQTVRLNRTVGPSRVAVCFENRGRHSVALYGGVAAAARSSTAVVDGQSQPVDLELHFTRSSRSLASLVPEMFHRAALFGFEWEGGWTYFALALLLVVGGPLLLVRAVTAADGDADDVD
jgi:hypothetical protein